MTRCEHLALSAAKVAKQDKNPVYQTMEKGQVNNDLQLIG